VILPVVRITAICLGQQLLREFDSTRLVPTFDAISSWRWFLKCSLFMLHFIEFLSFQRMGSFRGIFFAFQSGISGLLTGLYRWQHHFRRSSGIATLPPLSVKSLELLICIVSDLRNPLQALFMAFRERLREAAPSLPSAIFNRVHVFN